MDTLAVAHSEEMDAYEPPIMDPLNHAAQAEWQTLNSKLRFNPGEGLDGQACIRADAAAFRTEVLNPPAQSRSTGQQDDGGTCVNPVPRLRSPFAFWASICKVPAPGGMSRRRLRLFGHCVNPIAGPVGNQG